MTELKKTALHPVHCELGARMVDFGGWDMPVQYSSISEEHQAVRQRLGIFDVSHMGTFRASGPEALEWLESLVPNRVSALVPGKALYTQLCNQQGGTLDDLLIYRLDETVFQLVVNASNREQDWDWMTSHLPEQGVVFEDLSAQTCILALQGPMAAQVLSQVLNQDLSTIGNYHLSPTDALGFPLLLARTGYTGEDGFEIFVAPEKARQVWELLLQAGQGAGIRPCGLGARDTLRLESAMPLYGHELDLQTSPLEAGLAWSVKLDKPQAFIGKSALQVQKDQGLRKKRLGFRLTGTRRAPRQGYTLWLGERQIGLVTSGTLSPSLNEPIGLALIEALTAEEIQAIEIDIRGQRMPIEPIKLPFYRRPNRIP
ncbi:glycine cleavage system protein T [bacterium (Candidatus Blackallbacteria) CG17_big_fil_post_rev_8_21_14_2_50_48_46]|uniref:Aminomethyltransferase n=1 Tax=bacterium (Candidatus Blackallbacteria) CG17_big_fil_post_rev_8_21_14_2_50_48_46 TaxID=2014261 RepID=A0A2M7G0V4_9BACT|nr:MAG: glycine cleavage system protein T [bacterium (Candidatus Blackallbacteria) CG18_big_fil_WC_8_21_14_2_50_49_26]PIW14890.1 MAG: glycine cleavage system protein T [bacterium (Candidatus Blackallbacteria) CG17_big_fil_post_rev_8_21_14_2_50_48_46]PIW44322.1 MAG: glycine cleavage system protein T [bacterium (Candidatus Blackallbacteria) CG13_big_fil_rev_8_21_14_2_50_49_14]